MYKTYMLEKICRRLIFPIIFLLLKMVDSKIIACYSMHRKIAKKEINKMEKKQRKKT